MKRIWLKTKYDLVALSQFCEFRVRREEADGKVRWNLLGVPWPNERIVADPILLLKDRVLYSSPAEDDVLKALRQIQGHLAHDDKIITVEQ